jgi:hypothetical protein
VPKALMGTSLQIVLHLADKKKRHTSRVTLFDISMAIKP